MDDWGRGGASGGGEGRVGTEGGDWTRRGTTGEEEVAAIHWVSWDSLLVIAPDSRSKDRGRIIFFSRANFVC